MRVRVKICGIRRVDEALAAVEAGADALGLNLWPQSPRYVAPAAAKEIMAAVSPMVSCVGVFVNEDRQRLCDLASDLGLHAVQLHGDEPPDYCCAISDLRVIKAIRVGRDFDLKSLQAYSVGAILLDSKIKGAYGGTGQRFDWRVAIEAKRLASIILAGGLTVDNVADAISSVKPMAIDVCSGVEAEPGRKDLFKLRQFMNAVEWANASLASEPF
jgi:phosphoribosylanthranilate isomerase